MLRLRLFCHHVSICIMALLAINAVLAFIRNISAIPSHLRQVNFQTKLLDIQTSSFFVQFSNSLFGVVMISRLCWSSHKHNLLREIIHILLFLKCCLILVRKIIVKAVTQAATAKFTNLILILITDFKHRLFK